jgi:glycosyltransferase involved in cell wall biosynthesis
VVAHEETGLICEEGSAECLAASLRRLLDDPELRDRCARQALHRYETLYAPERVRDQWLSMLTEPH